MNHDLCASVHLRPRDSRTSRRAQETQGVEQGRVSDAEEHGIVAGVVLVGPNPGARRAK